MSAAALRLPVAPPEQMIFVRAHDFQHRSITIRKGALARAAMKAAALMIPDLTRLRVAVDASLAALPDVPRVNMDVAARASESRNRKRKLLP